MRTTELIDNLRRNARIIERELLKLQHQRLLAKYRPDQPRAPAGTSVGGQWIDALEPGNGPSGIVGNVLRTTFRFAARRISPQREAECEVTSVKVVEFCGVAAAARFMRLSVW